MVHFFAFKEISTNREKPPNIDYMFRMMTSINFRTFFFSRFTENSYEKFPKITVTANQKKRLRKILFFLRWYLLAKSIIFFRYYWLKNRNLQHINGGNTAELLSKFNYFQDEKFESMMWFDPKNFVIKFINFENNEIKTFSKNH